MSYIEQVAKALLKFPDYNFSDAYVRLRFNLTDREHGELVKALQKAGIARIINSRWVLYTAAQSYAKELCNA